MNIFLFLILFFSIPLYTAEHQREFRAIWVASVFNIDWPSATGLSQKEQKEEILKILDMAQELKFNAIILQIKPTSDAFYSSKLSPWSRYLSGTQGVHPGYDPLTFFIEEAQKRSLETHLWVNPFRILNGEGWDTLSANHIARKNPDWVIEYNNRYYFDPGNPKTRQYILKEMLEIVQNYDLDALHMDDYFYPYKSYSQGKLLPFNDNKSWTKYQASFKNRDDWRRDNVNIFVKELSDAIKKEKSHVKFGISPFGVWRNKSVDPKGSDTEAGQTNFDDLYADVLLWTDNNWVDYILPQLYWHFDTKAAPYGTLVEWWNKQITNSVDLYVGLGIYKLHENNWPITHIKEQIDFARKHSNIKGFASYSAKWILQDTKGIKDYIKKEIHPYYALVPPSTKMNSIKPKQVKNFTLEEKNNKYSLKWENSDPKATHYFVLYRFPKAKILQSVENIIGIISAKNKLEWVLESYDDNDCYGITAVSRLHQESSLLTLDDVEKIQGLEMIDQIILSNN
ncbi:MAG: glycoside hydrolase family 10 protein [Brevinema sp.]